MSLKQSLTLIQSLRDPALYTPRPSDVELLETHISWVLLADPYAYKIKKPVDLGFADFSTLKRRQRFCHEELRLNRRLAPHLYVDVVPICGSPELPTVGGDGEPIEFAVRMKQFRQQDLLSHALESDRLTAEHIDALAREVAAFHARIEVAPPDDDFGTPDAVRRPVRKNFEHLQSADVRHDAELRLLQTWCDSEFDRRREVFAGRLAQGFVCECHGDMHLGNMILELRPGGEAIVVFDCIEFIDSLRWIDVMSEVAFVVMDLEDRGRPDFAHRFLSGYLEATGDYAGLAVLRYYLVYRALVRAKVAAIRLKQSGLTDSDRAEEQESLAGYLRQATRYTRRSQPFLAITHGLSGSGKTTGSAPVVESPGAVRIRSDVERKRLFGLGPLQSSNSGVARDLYSDDATEATYDRLADCAAASIGNGFPAVVDAVFLNRERRDRFRKLARELCVPFWILDFHAPEQVLLHRIEERKRFRQDASEADRSVLEHQIRTQDPLGRDEQPLVIAIESEDPRAGTRLVSDMKRRIASLRSDCGTDREEKPR